MAMAVNPELFLDGHNWCAEEDQVAPEEVNRVARVASVAPAASAAVSLQEEVMSVLQSHNFTGLWDFFAPASHVRQRPVQSVYPSLVQSVYPSLVQSVYPSLVQSVYPSLGWPVYEQH